MYLYADGLILMIPFKNLFGHLDRKDILEYNFEMVKVALHLHIKEITWIKDVL